MEDERTARAAETLSKLLGAVVAIGSGESAGGVFLAAVPPEGPLVAALSTDAIPMPGDQRLELIADLLHIIIPAGPNRIDVLVPLTAVDRGGDTVTIASDWLDQVRIAAMAAQIVASQEAALGADWAALLKERAVIPDDTIRRYSLSLERAIDLYVRERDADVLLRHLAAQPLERDAGRLADGDVLRGTKDLVISLLAVATRSATSAGTMVPVAFGISDYFIREVERLTRVPDLTPSLLRALTALGESVDQSRQQGRSALVRAAEEWIFLHLDTDLRPSAIAAALTVNADYFATQFRRETGVTIDHYVQRQKVEQAKTMLTHTTIRISDICTRLNFYDQSHLTRVFRKLTGETPHHYRVRTRPRAVMSPLSPAPMDGR